MIPPCNRCLADGGTELSCQQKVKEDIELLNDSRVHILSRAPGMTRETIHALADVVRLMNRVFL